MKLLSQTKTAHIVRDMLHFEILNLGSIAVSGLTNQYLERPNTDYLKMKIHTHYKLK